jgi:hypothetical protein
VKLDVDHLAAWLREQVMGAEFCRNHPWGPGADQDYWRSRVSSCPASTAAEVVAAVDAVLDTALFDTRAHRDAIRGALAAEERER